MAESFDELVANTSERTQKMSRARTRQLICEMLVAEMVEAAEAMHESLEPIRAQRPNLLERILRFIFRIR